MKRFLRVGGLAVIIAILFSATTNFSISELASTAPPDPKMTVVPYR